MPHVRRHAGDVVQYAGEFGLAAFARSRLNTGLSESEPPPQGGKFAGLIR